MSAGGWTYNKTFVLYDYETESMWYPLEGTKGLRCISGPLADKVLGEFPSVHLRWSHWLKDHPQSLVSRDPDG